jgi:hypothetical protein
MTNDESVAPWKFGAGIVAPINRVNLALPFSTITVQERSKEFAELSAIVAELLTALETGNGSLGEAITVLRQRAEALAARSG